MTTHKLLGIWLVTGLALLLLVVPALASPAEDQAAALDKARAAALLEKGQAAAAYELYSRLWREDPQDPTIALGLARSATRAKRWNQAAYAYEDLVEQYPYEPALHAELANVYMMLGDRAGAESALARVRELDGLTSREQTDLALDALEAKYSRSQIHGKLRFGALYDSNANQGPASDLLNLGGWRVQVPDAKAKESFGAYLGADIDFSHRFYRDSPWQVVGDVRAFWRGMAASSLANSNSRESQWGRVALGLRHLTDDTLAELRFKGEVFDYEFKQRVSAGGAEGTWLWAPRPDIHLILSGGLDRRDYYQDSLRNGWYGWLGGHSRFYLGQDRHELLLGARYLGGSANKTDYGYKGWEGSAGLTFKLPHGIDLSPSISWTEEYYRGPATALEIEKRKDERLRAGLGLTYRLTDSWSVETGYTYTDNRSRSELYTYERHAVNAGLAWEF